MEEAQRSPTAGPPHVLRLSCKESSSASRGESPEFTCGYENKLFLAAPRILVFTSMLRVDMAWIFHNSDA